MNIFFVNNTAMITTIEFKKLVTSVYIFCNIIGKFSY